MASNHSPPRAGTVNPRLADISAPVAVARPSMHLPNVRRYQVTSLDVLSSSVPVGVSPDRPQVVAAFVAVEPVGPATKWRGWNAVDAPRSPSGTLIPISPNRVIRSNKHTRESHPAPHNTMQCKTARYVCFPHRTPNRTFLPPLRHQTSLETRECEKYIERVSCAVGDSGRGPDSVYIAVTYI